MLVRFGLEKQQQGVNSSSWLHPTAYGCSQEGSVCVCLAAQQLTSSPDPLFLFLGPNFVFNLYHIR